jgi:hypothetical protein
VILKASQRGGGADLAVHLMRTDDNEHVSLYELRGFASDTLKDAFKEAEAISRGTHCRQYLFSLSLSPPGESCVSAASFETAIDEIEERLGLTGQPRAIVFHEKEGRRHAHCVWSRIDADTMTARHLPFFKNRLMEISRRLYLEHGWTMPRGMEDSAKRDPANFTLAEWQRAKRLGTDPRELKHAIQQCWASSDGRRAFERALSERGLFLARGDKRSFVVLDHDGEVHALPRLLDVKTKDVRARLGEGEDLPGVAETQATIGRKMSPAIRRHIAESRARFQKRASTLEEYKTEMTRRHREARETLDARQKSEWDEETRERAGRLPKGFAGLWHRLTGKYQAIRQQNEAEANATQARHADELHTLIESQFQQRSLLQDRFTELREAQARQLGELRSDVGRYLRFTRGEDAPGRAREADSGGLKLGR